MQDIRIELTAELRASVPADRIRITIQSEEQDFVCDDFDAITGFLHDALTPRLSQWDSTCPRDHLRILLLDRSEFPTTQTVPWERLLPSWGGQPLAIHRDVTVVRLISGASEPREIDLGDGIHILAVGCQPRDPSLGRLDIPRELERVDKAVLPFRQLLDVHLTKQVISSKANLEHFLTRTTPSIFHYVGHCRNGSLCLEDLRGTGMSLLDTSGTVSLLVNSRVGLAVLNACESLPLAVRLAREGVAAVATLDPVQDDLAAAFAAAFYRALGETKCVGRAVSEGRHVVWHTVQLRSAASERETRAWSEFVYVAPALTPEPLVFVTGTDRPRRRLTVDTNLPDAAITVSGAFVAFGTWSGEVLRGAQHVVSVSREGYVEQTVTIPPDERTVSYFNVELRPERYDAVVTVQPPLAGVVVECALNDSGTPETVRLVTDALGQAHFQNLRVGRYDVFARLELADPPHRLAVERNGDGRVRWEVPLTFDRRGFVRHAALRAVNRLAGTARRPATWVAALTLAATIGAAGYYLHLPGRVPEDMRELGGTGRYAFGPDETLEAVEADGFSYVAEMRGIAYAVEPARIYGDAPRTVTLSKPFFIDRTEVTTEAYGKFIKAIADNPNALAKFSRQLDRGGAAAKDHRPPDWEQQAANPRTPVSNVNYWNAQAYCLYANKRLPTADEWEMAARGPKGHRYPWGNEFDPSRFNGYTSTYTHRDVDQYPDGRTGTGIADLAGNVAEWTNRMAQGDTTIPGIKGGSFSSRGKLEILSHVFTTVPGDQRSSSVGFRCSADLPREGMVEVAAGPYPLGGPRNVLFDLWRKLDITSGDLLVGSIGRAPVKRDEVRRFWLDETEVSVAHFFGFLQEASQRPHRRHRARHASEPPGHHDEPANLEAQMLTPDWPVTNVDWWTAHAFCAMQGRRLPTAEELEYATGGPSNHRYYAKGVWTDGLGQVFVNFRDVGIGKLADVKDDRFRNDAGIFHLGGNVAEWSADPTEHFASRAVIMGGSVNEPVELGALKHFYRAKSKDTRLSTVGFRCALSPD